MVLRTAGRASHPATVRGAGRMRGGSPLGARCHVRFQEPSGTGAERGAGTSSCRVAAAARRELSRGSSVSPAGAGGTSPAALTARLLQELCARAVPCSHTTWCPLPGGLAR